jgi:hypothetical protein
MSTSTATPLGKLSDESPKAVLWRALKFFFGLIVIVIVLAVYFSADEAGFIVHHHNVPTWIKGDWMVGEYRICNMQVANAAYSREDRATMPRLYCGTDDNGFTDFAQNVVGSDISWSTLRPNYHVLPATFWGRIDRTEQPTYFYKWRCQREADSLSCNALS